MQFIGPMKRLVFQEKLIDYSESQDTAEASDRGVAHALFLSVLAAENAGKGETTDTGQFAQSHSEHTGHCCVSRVSARMEKLSTGILAGWLCRHRLHFPHQLSHNLSSLPLRFR